MVPNTGLSAYWTSKEYAYVAKYQPTVSISITNESPGILKDDKIFLDQASSDFDVENVYTLRFTPTNPIPKIGMIKIIYPNNVKIADETKFVEACGAVTSLSFTGAKYCSLNTKTRTVWLFDIFKD